MYDTLKNGRTQFIARPAGGVTKVEVAGAHTNWMPVAMKRRADGTYQATVKLPPGARGLDFGSGPTSSLARLFTEAGRPCASHDLYYASDPAALSVRHDFVVCCEALEHFRQPAAEFARMLAALKPGGWLGVMTQLRDEAAVPFAAWFYKNDLTHISFHSRRSAAHLAAVHGLSLEAHPWGVSLFQSRAS